MPRRGSRNDYGRSRIAAVFLATLALAVHAGRAQPAVPPDLRPGARDPEELLFLLRYISADYGGAVRGGRVVDEFEHHELVEFARALVEETGSGLVTSEVARDLLRLQGLVRDLRPWSEVRALVSDLAPRLGQDLRVSAEPPGRPDLSRGRELYSEDCAICPGATGAGDGSAAAGQEPPPSSFRGERIQLLSPHQVFSAARFGVQGTAMPSFGRARSTPELWDVAFYVMTLRGGFDPEPANPPLGLSLHELAEFSNDELIERVRLRRPDAGIAAIDHGRANPPEPAAAVPVAAGDETDDSGLTVALALERTFERVARRVFPAVVGVTIYTADPSWTPERLAAARGTGWQETHPDELRYPGYRPVGSGSGVLVAPEGYLLTGHHVIAEPTTGRPAELIDVELEDNLHFRARLIGAEPTVDLAVVKVEAPFKTPSAPLGDSDGVAVGHWTLALADPPGVERSFDVGIIAARPERQCYQQQQISTLLQSSLRLPVRSFGGPLVNVRGEVIGITTPGGPQEGPGQPGGPVTVYALPINLALTLYNALKVAESRRSPWLGISVLELGWKLRQEVGAAPRTGVYIDGVFEPSPASRAGIQVGDVLTEMAGNRILSVPDFQRWLYLVGIGKAITVDLYRNGRLLEKKLTIEERPPAARAR